VRSSALARLDFPLALGPEDRAVLDRLRTLALLFRAAAGRLPELAMLEIGLWADHHNVVSPFTSVDWGKDCWCLVALAGWSEVATTGWRGQESVSDGFYHRAVAAEFPTGCPPALLQLLATMRSSNSVHSTLATLALAGWHVPVGEWTLRPLLPAQISAHEALEAVLAAAAHGLGDGLLGHLARRAIAVLSEGQP